MAQDLGESVIFLKALKDDTPQQTALNLFNHFFPGYETKMQLVSMNNLAVVRPGFLKTMLGKLLTKQNLIHITSMSLYCTVSSSICSAICTWNQLQNARLKNCFK